MFNRGAQCPSDQAQQDVIKPNWYKWESVIMWKSKTITVKRLFSSCSYFIIPSPHEDCGIEGVPEGVDLFQHYNTDHVTLY